jgi:hypothetical protein
MNLGNVVSLDRNTGRGVLLVADGDTLYRVALRPREVRALPRSLKAGDRVAIEIVREPAGLRLIIDEARGLVGAKG